MIRITLLLMVWAMPALAQADGHWPVDPRTGCKLWTSSTEAETVTWSGGCTNGLAEGPGKASFTLATGGKPYTIEGTLRAGKLQGRGTALYRNGARYEGQFSDGRPGGQGTYSFPDGARYTGQMRKGDFNGHGVHTWPNGDRYEGNWANDKADGQGTKTTADGKVYSGTWSNGCFRQGDRWSTVGATREQCGYK